MLPHRATALNLLAEAEQLNPGPWAAHSRHVARAAEVIALHHPLLDPERAYVLGLLHDVGRRTGPNRDRHILDGYDHLLRLGYPDAARIALTHSFVLQDIQELQGQWDGTADEHARLAALVAAQAYTAEDRLIQLCDVLALPEGCCVLEMRLVDIALRYGVGALTLDKWRALLQLKAQFDRELGVNLYTLLPDLMRTTLR